MFLGDADQQAALSTAPIKAALRYWWRVSGVHKAKNAKELFEKENELFGSSDEEFGKSKVSVWVEGNLAGTNAEIPTGNINVKFSSGKIPVNAFVYLGMGAINLPKKHDKRITPSHSYLEPESNFKIHIISVKKDLELHQELIKTIFLFCEFGALGSRSRNGWGSIQVSSNVDRECLFKELLKIAKPMENCFSVDYPHCLGKNSQNKISIWRSERKPSWQECMKEIAQMYIGLRKKFSVKDYKGQPGNRPLFGYPLKPWMEKRFSSPLRFVVRKKDNHFIYRFVHVPALIPQELNKDKQYQEIWSSDQQKKFWFTVHQHLDDKLDRLTQV